MNGPTLNPYPEGAVMLDDPCVACEQAEATTTCGAPEHACRLCQWCRDSLDGLEYLDDLDEDEGDM